MRLRLRHLPFVVAAGIGALLIGGPAQSQTPPTASIVASDNQFRTAAGDGPVVTIAPGGTVGFSYPSGSSIHNVVFANNKPSSCVQTAGTSRGAVPPLPNPPSGPGWVGQCTFDIPATYDFICEVHDNMIGSVTVAGPGGTPPPPPPPVPPPPSPLAPPPPPPTGPAASQLRVSMLQRGLAVRGSVVVRSAGSRLLARAFARRRSLSGGRSTLQVEVGRQLRRSVGGTRVAFTVNLNAVARRALRRNGRLAITLRLTVTPPTGARSYTATRPVILKPSV